MAERNPRDGQSVRVAFDGEEGLALPTADPPEIVLLDLGMPRMNGYEVAERIRARAWGKELLLAAVTGWAEEETRARTEKAGFDVHLVKPVARAALREVLAMDAVRAVSASAAPPPGHAEASFLHDFAAIPKQSWRRKRCSPALEPGDVLAPRMREPRSLLCEPTYA